MTRLISDLGMPQKRALNCGGWRAGQGKTYCTPLEDQPLGHNPVVMESKKITPGILCCFMLIPCTALVLPLSSIPMPSSHWSQCSALPLFLYKPLFTLPLWSFISGSLRAEAIKALLGSHTRTLSVHCPGSQRAVTRESADVPSGHPLKDASQGRQQHSYIE